MAELLSGESQPAQLCRWRDISLSLLYHWKRQYSLGKFNNEPIEEAALQCGPLDPETKLRAIENYARSLTRFGG